MRVSLAAPRALVDDSRRRTALDKNGQSIAERSRERVALPLAPERRVDEREAVRIEAANTSRARVGLGSA